VVGCSEGVEMYPDLQVFWIKDCFGFLPRARLSKVTSYRKTKCLCFFLPVLRLSKYIT
jgi:hypothetical protein